MSPGKEEKAKGEEKVILSFIHLFNVRNGEIQK